MIRPLLIAFSALTIGTAGILIGSLFPEVHYKLVQPCGLSKWFGSTEKERKLGLLESLMWRVVDGDTMWCERRRIRLAGFDAPEPHKNRAKCPREVRLGREAQEHLTQLLKQHGDGNWKLVFANSLDSFGRPLAKLLVNGVPVQDKLIPNGLAQRWDNPDKDPKPTWCPPSPPTGQ